MCSRDIALHMQAHPVAKQQEFVEPEQFKFRDDGIFPNSDLPLLVYRRALTTEGGDYAFMVEKRFAQNGWSNSWRKGGYSLHHFYRASHGMKGDFLVAASMLIGGGSWSR